MEKKPKKLRKKPHFCHDENLEFFSLKKSSSKLALFHNILKLTKAGTLDPEVIRICDKNDYHIITHNTKDFKAPSSKIKIGIICIGLKRELEWIPKFIKLLKYFPKHKDYYNKNILIDNKVTIKSRQTNETELL